MPHRPKRGSLGYSPRKRAKRHYPRVRATLNDEKTRVLGFSAYKAGTTHVVMNDDRPNVASTNKEISKVVTIFEVPPMNILAIRVYKTDNKAQRIITEVWASDIPVDLSRKLTLPDKLNHKKKLQEIQELIEKDEELEVRILVSTQPRLAKIKKKMFS